MHEVHNKTQFVKKFCNRSAASAAAAELELRGHAGGGWKKAELLRSEHAAMVQWYVVAGRLVQSYNSPAGKVWTRTPAGLFQQTLDLNSDPPQNCRGYSNTRYEKIGSSAGITNTNLRIKTKLVPRLLSAKKTKYICQKRHRFSLWKKMVKSHNKSPD